MNRHLKLATVALMLGMSTLASAQTLTRAQTFASQLQQYQNLSSTAAGTYAFHPAPVTRATAEDPVGKPSFASTIATLQAESSNSDQFESRPVLSAQAADPVGKETFAEKFAQLQAASSNSGEYGFAAGSNVPASEANSTLVAGKAIAKPLTWHIAARS